MPQVLSKRLHTFTHHAAVRRTFIFLGVFLLIYSIVGFLVLPLVAKSQAQTLFADKLHRRGTIGKVEVNPFTFVVTVRDLRLMEPEGDATFASFDTLTVNLSSESVLRLAPVIQQARLSRPYVHLVRTDAHHYNIDDLIALMSNQPPSPQPARFSVNNIQVEDGRIDFQDRPEKTSHAVTGLSLGIPFISSLPSQVNIFVEPLLHAQVDGSPLLVKGKARPFADPKEAVMELNLQGLDVARYIEYLPYRPGFRLRGGRLDLRLSASFRQPHNGTPSLALSGAASLKSAQVADLDGAPMLRLPELSVTLAAADIAGGRYTLSKVLLDGPETDVVRERNGGFNLEHLLPPAAPAARHAGAPAAKPAALHIAIDDLEIRRGTLRYADAHAARPLQSSLEHFGLRVRKVAVDTAGKTVHIGEIASDRAGLFVRQDKPAQAAATSKGQPEPQTGTERTASAGGASYAVRIDRLAIENWSARLEDRGARQVTEIAPLSLSVHNLSTASSALANVALKATVNKSGRLAAGGKLGLAPFRTDLDLDANGVDILPLQPLIADKINLRVTQASLSGKGRLQLDTAQDGTLKGGFRGDASLNNVATVDEASGSDFVRWKSLRAGGMDMRFAPFALGVDNLALADFFARVIIDPSGRINLQDIARGDGGERKSLTGANAAGSGTPGSGAAAAASRRKAPTAMPPISIRRLTFQGGRVRFTDNFIKPNYSASLTDLGGTVGGLSSDPSATASVDLRGEVNRAPLSIVGRINPLREDLLLDLKANVRGMELAGLSPYADRYVGYGIEKGKLSFEVAYTVENRKLSASNRLILDQLTLSEKSASSVATKLPVKLAIALLKDRNGVIDVNVPIEGSLDDPQFSIGGIVLKVIGNAIVKAVSKPFALLGAVFGGGGNADLSSVPFAPGRAAIQPAAEGTLNALAKALANRPGLKLEITGWSDRSVDYDGLKHAAVERKVRLLKVNDLRAHGQPAEPASVTVTADEYPALLARVYADEKFPKPRNAIGLPKRLPVEEMEKLIMANTAIGDDDLNALASRRAQAARDWLIKFGKIPGERLFILAPKTGQQEQRGNASALTKVEFSLS